MQENQNLELAKTNRVAIWGHISVVIALLFFVIMQAREQTVKPINVTILAVLGIVPIIIEVFLYRKDRGSHLIKHFFINKRIYISNTSQGNISNFNSHCFQ